MTEFSRIKVFSGWGLGGSLFPKGGLPRVFLVLPSLQRQEAEFAVLAEEYAAVGTAFLGDGDGAGVDEGIVLVGGEVGHVGVAVEEHIALGKGREVVFVVEVAVGGEERAAVDLEQAVVGQHGEGEHHLIDLAVAVAAHAEYAIPERVEHGGDLGGRVVPGQGVARAVVEYVAQQQQAVGLFAPEGLEQQPALVIGTVNIGRNHQFHRHFLRSICFSIAQRAEGVKPRLTFARKACIMVL